MATAPDELTSVVSLGRDPRGPAVTFSCAGRATEAGESGSCARCGRRPATDVHDRPAPYLDRQRAPDPGYPGGRRHYWKSGYLRASPTTPWTRSSRVPPIPRPATGIGLQRLRGAAARVPADATAFPHRAEQYDLLILAQWDDPGTDEHLGWAPGFRRPLAHLPDAVYVNNLGREDPAASEPRTGRTTPGSRR